MRKQIKYEIPPDADRSICGKGRAKWRGYSGCGNEIWWVKTKKGKFMPVDPDGTPHWATCPKASKFKKKRLV